MAYCWGCGKEFLNAPEWVCQRWCGRDLWMHNEECRKAWNEKLEPDRVQFRLMFGEEPTDYDLEGLDEAFLCRSCGRVSRRNPMFPEDVEESDNFCWQCKKSLKIPRGI